MFFHELRHIQANKGIHCVKHIACKALYQFRLAHTCRAHKNEGNRFFLRADTHTVSADGLCHRLHRLILTHNMGLQAVSQILNLLVLLRLNFAGRNFCPKLNNSGQVLNGHCRCRDLIQLLNFCRQLAQLASNHSQTLIILVFRVLGEHAQLQLIVVPFLFLFRTQGNFFATQIHIGAGFIQQVDGLIRQKTVGNISLRQHHTLPRNLRRDRHAMEVGIAFGNALHDLAGLLNGGFTHRNRLEAALQSGILFDVLAVFIKSGSANHLNFSPGEGRF